MEFWVQELQGTFLAFVELRRAGMEYAGLVRVGKLLAAALVDTLLCHLDTGECCRRCSYTTRMLSKSRIQISGVEGLAMTAGGIEQKYKYLSRFSRRFYRYYS